MKYIPMEQGGKKINKQTSKQTELKKKNNNNIRKVSHK